MYDTNPHQKSERVILSAWLHSCYLHHLFCFSQHQHFEGPKYREWLHSVFNYRLASLAVKYRLLVPAQFGEEMVAIVGFVSLIVMSDTWKIWFTTAHATRVNTIQTQTYSFQSLSIPATTFLGCWLWSPLCHNFWWVKFLQNTVCFHHVITTQTAQTFIVPTTKILVCSTYQLKSDEKHVNTSHIFYSNMWIWF